MKFPSSLLAVCAVGTLLASTVVAEEKAKAPATTKPAKAAPAPKPASPTGASRWIQFQTLELATRFRYIDTRPGRVTERDQQYRISSKVQLHLVPEGRSYIQFRVETGSSFPSSWTYMGPGLHNREWALNVKSLFFAQKLGKHFEAQVGGIEFDSGAGTEATYADNDGWLMGYRARVSTSGKGLLPHKLSLTIGHIGDFRRPNVFSRFHRLEDPNYVQVLAQKSFRKKHEASLEYDAIQDIHFLRTGYRWKKIPVVVFDELQAETVARMTDNPAFGWSGALSKTFDTSAKWKASIVYSDIPAALYNRNAQQVLVNGDVYALAKRLGGSLNWQPAKDWQFQWYGGRRLDAFTGTTRWRTHVMLRYNFANLANNALR